ncbi:PEP-CTERM sorting domain-containing protein [Marinobacter sp.]|uniref:PEP-CTERM sorting domain-containing protein n=1 Tax=Marinobacter sp. TaxID=50741 RepID=UPI0034A4255C
MHTFNLFARSAAVLLVLIFSISANALILYPADHDTTSNKTGALNAGEVAALFNTSDLSLLYKSDYQEGVALGLDSGPFANDYSTLFSPAPEDPTNALIEWGGANFITCPECYLVVKNGIQPQYLFDLGSWGGMEDLDLRDFYADTTGAISHVAIFGKSTVRVPEPGTLALLGLGLIGLTLTHKKRRARSILSDITS